MTAITQKKPVEAGFLELYEKLPATRPFKQANSAAETRIKELGWPGKKHEMFSYVELRGFAEKSFDFSSAQKAPSTDSVKSLIYKGCERSVIVMVDGRYSSQLSDISGVNSSVTVAELDPKNISLTGIKTETDIFSILNSLFLSGGTFIEVKKGANLETPIQVLHISTGCATTGGALPAYSPRVVLNIGDGAKAGVYIKYSGIGGAYFVNTVYDVEVGEGAALSLNRLQADSAGAVNFSKITTLQKKESRLNIVATSSGGEPARNNFECRLGGEGAVLSLLSLAILDGAEQAHNYTRVDHEAPGCTSFEHYKNILKGASVSSVDTTVTVQRGAQLAVSEQLINNLMFSHSARAKCKPNLSIHADDVKCKHGATTGRIDENQVFYLMSRGISESAAKAIIVTGFAKSVLNAIPHPPAAQEAANLLLKKL
jgi:Fe-S cluster assembly protein SufD